MPGPAARRTQRGRTRGDVLTGLVAPALTYGTLPLATWALRGWLWPSTITSSRCADAAVHDPDAPRAVTSVLHPRSGPDPWLMHSAACRTPSPA